MPLMTDEVQARYREENRQRWAAREEAITDVDREALQRAMEIVLREEPDRAGQLDWKARALDGGWLESATFAAYVCQTKKLRLKPWETPPMHAYEDDERLQDGRDIHSIGKAIRVRDRLLAAGLSRYEPDPARALRENR